MKKLLVILTALAFVLCFSTISFAGIVGTAHDLSGEGWNTTSEICVVCHTPHNASTVTDAPLWNHTVTSATFTPYPDTGTLDATVGQPAGVSLLCLSCHDGTVGIDAFGDNTPVPTMITGDALLGTDLSNDHPISFTYDAALATADGELFDPTTTSSGLGGNIDVDMLFGAGNDQLQCASCHDVHNDTNNPFLRKANTNSALCLTCHDK